MAPTLDPELVARALAGVHDGYTYNGEIGMGPWDDEDTRGAIEGTDDEAPILSTPGALAELTRLCAAEWERCEAADLATHEALYR